METLSRYDCSGLGCGFQPCICPAPDFIAFDDKLRFEFDEDALLLTVTLNGAVHVIWGDQLDRLRVWLTHERVVD